MRRSWRIWLAFAACLAVVLAAMGWISREAVRTQRAEQQANRQAAAQEKVRLALWRMDSALTPLITQETARPYFTYTAFHPVDRAYTRMYAEVEPNAILVPSPLLARQPGMILLHFQFAPDGELTSPQAPVGNQRDLAETGYATHEQIEEAAALLARLKAALRPADLLARLPQIDAAQLAAATQPATPAPRNVQPQTVAPDNSFRGRVAQQQSLDVTERQRRADVVQNSLQFNGSNMANFNTNIDRANTAGGQGPADNPYLSVAEGPLHAVWVDGQLLLARRMSINGRPYAQGCWLDWDETRAWLREQAADLLPAADLEPVKGRSAERSAANDTNLLAAIPARLVPGPVPVEPGDGVWPVGWPLLVAWVGLLLGAAAVAAVLQGTISLSERRGAFVSAVTHELRTPLTTFRLYAELLAGGMIADEAKRQDYLQRLCQESDRLSHLVENVLAYARLSSPRAGGGLEQVTLGELVGRSRDRLAGRAERAGMRLAIDGRPDAAGTVVAANVGSVEQILTNLVDNACKYAAGAADRTIHVELESARDGGLALIRVRDHGPGIGKAAAGRLFQPFSKSAGEAAASAPGVGLGLALSRRLARDMGGDLRLDGRAGQGACFVLSLRTHV